MVVYKGEFPIPNEFLNKHENKRIATEVELQFYDIAWAEGVPGLNEIVDDRLGVDLEDLHYTPQCVRRGRIVLHVTGVVPN